jgi:hypothetical protein
MTIRVWSSAEKAEVVLAVLTCPQAKQSPQSTIIKTPSLSHGPIAASSGILTLSQQSALNVDLSQAICNKTRLDHLWRILARPTNTRRMVPGSED